MKKFVLCLIILLVPSLVFAGTWCQWDGSAGINCKSSSNTYIILDDHRVTVSAENLNPRGWYERIVTQPTIGANQVRDAEVWGFADNQISLTWSVRDLTAAEIQARTAGAMSLSQYYIWKTLLTTGVITQQQAADHLPQELIDAYQARDAIENP